MNKIPLSKYNLEMTLMGGQSFSWDKDGDFLYGFTEHNLIKLRLEKNFLYWQTYPEKDNFSFLEKYLRLDIDYPLILKKIKKDDFTKAAIKKCPNIRLLKQDFEQTLLSFLVSSNNNIKSIRSIIREMCKKFGQKTNIDDKTIFLFPKTEVIASASLDTLLECKLGFRAKFIKGAARHLLKTNLHKKIQAMSEENARAELKEMNGVGDKIADCVLVFSLGFDNVTPLDVWGKRVLTKYYKLNPKMKYDDMRRWINAYFEGYGAWAGQFLFEYIRNNND